MCITNYAVLWSGRTGKLVTEDCLHGVKDITYR